MRRERRPDPGMALLVCVLFATASGCGGSGAVEGLREGDLGPPRTSAFANTFEPGREWDFVVPVRSGSRGTALVWEVTDWTGAPAGVTGRLSIALYGAGKDVALTLDPPSRVGWFSVRFALMTADNRKVGACEAVVAVLPAAPARPSDTFGVYVNMTGGYLDPAQIERNVKIGRRAGAGWGRSLFDWDHVEPSKGRFHFKTLDEVIDLARANEMQLLFHLPLSAPWNSSAPPGTRVDISKPLEKAGGWFAYPPKRLQDYADMVSNVVAHTRGKVTYWEVWNEPDLPLYWKGRPDAVEYEALLRTASRAAKQANAEARIVAAAPFNPGDPSFVAALGKAGGAESADVFSSHIYGQMPTPPDEAMRRLRAALAADGGRKPVFVTELGWVTEDAGPASQRKMAAYVVQACAQLLADGVEKIFWHAARGFGPEARQPECTSALVRYDMNPSMAYPAYATVVRELSGATPTAAPYAMPAGVTGCFFRKASGEGIGVLWSAGKEMGLSLPARGGGLAVVDIMGNESVIKAGGGAVVLRLSPVPLFVRF